LPDLASRERDVLDLLAAGARNYEIARRLGLSEGPCATTSPRGY
jgi:DNA-binding CsgD family transcriptional regulator